ncbi:hypothetical protein C8F01DRAFT_1367876 [Mycena amicta]|nr:hypothetical protein C8F01DRAFT_1367876 [Mycena amicta]
MLGLRFRLGLAHSRHASTFRTRVRVNKLQLVVGASAITILTIATGIIFVDRGTHYWLERRLRRSKVIDPETKKWEWNIEAKDWLVEDGPADVQRAIREAWFAYHFDPPVEAGANAVDALHKRAEAALLNAIALVEASSASQPSTLAHLITRHAEILERSGPDGLLQSKTQYERVFEILARAGPQAAQIQVAQKLGHVNQKLGRGEDALQWWYRSLLAPGSTSLKSGVPSAPPSAPAAQRIVAATLVSLSAYYASIRQLEAARKIEEEGLNMLRSIPTQSLALASPPQALHHLTLLHRAAILSFHLAEVAYAQGRPVAECLQRLEDAAHSSERVAFVLTGTPMRDEMTPSPEEPILIQYSSNQFLDGPASQLLREARRSAALAWDLMGMLTERIDPSHKPLAFTYYTRALTWGGSASTGPLLRDDLSKIRENYLRLSR